MRNAIIFLDSGDTLVDESTEVRIKGDVVDHAEFFPGIKEVLFQPEKCGFPGGAGGGRPGGIL